MNTINRNHLRLNLTIKLLSGLVVLGLLATTEAFAQNFWQPAKGPYGGTVSALAINASGHIFAGTNDGVFRSMDNGNSWAPVNIGLTNTATNTTVQSLAINENGHIFAGTDRSGVFRSTDNGETWMPINTGLTYPYVLTFAFNSSGHIFAGTSVGAVFRSTDNGNHWTLAGCCSLTPVNALVINLNGFIFAGTDGDGVFRSADNGETWTQINTGLRETSVRSLTRNSSGHIFVGAFNGVFRSTNNGDTWKQIGLYNTSVSSFVINSSGHIFAGTTYGDGVYRSTDNGDMWTPINIGLTNITVKSLAISPSGHIFAVTNGGISRSTDNGNSWAPVNTGLTRASVNALAIDTSGDIFAGTNGGIFRSTDNGNSWMAVSTGLTHAPVNVFAINASGHIFAGTYDGGVFRSTDNGNNWVQSGLQNSTVNSLAINTSGHIFAGTFSDGLFLSTDNGNTWTRTFYFSRGGFSFSFRSLAINANGHIFVETSLGVYRSKDNGRNWTTINNGLTNFVNAFAINARGYIFAGTDGSGVFRSTDNGDTWTPVNTDLTNNYILSLVINANGRIFAGTWGGGIFRSMDNGNTWTSINTGLINTDVRSLAINANGRIFAGTNGGGVFQSTDSGRPIISHTSTSPQPSGQEIAVDTIITDDIGVVNAMLSYRQAGDSTFSLPLLMSRTGNNYHGSIPADLVTSRGVEYYIVATDSFGNIARLLSSRVFSIQVQVNGETKPKIQPNGSEQNAYRLFSMPLDLDDKSFKAILEDDLGKYDKKKWRFYALRDDYYMPGTLSYMEFPDTVKMKPGKAFWLIVKDENKIIDTGPAVSNKTDKEYPIALHPGWNFIGNPFNFSIPLEKLHLKGRVKPPTLRYFSGEWNNETANPVRKILPFEGYAVFDSTFSGDTLFVNPDLSASSNQLLKRAVSSHEIFSYSIRIIAQCQEACDVDNVAAMTTSASQYHDHLDQPEPPVIGEYVSVYFPHREWNTLAKTYCIDARPEPTDGEIWEFEVKTNIRDKVNLTFEGIGKIPKELEIWLVDDALKITQNLREQRQYAVAGAGADHPKQLKLVVGKRGFVDEKLAEARAIPTTYELSQNFPNPFNPATTIRYGLPQAERVTLKIYNLLGEEVARLINDAVQAAGYHAAIWDGRDKNGRVVSSGVYVYRMQAGSFSATKKLALIK